MVMDAWASASICSFAFVMSARVRPAFRALGLLLPLPVNTVGALRSQARHGVNVARHYFQAFTEPLRLLSTPVPDARGCSIENQS